MPLGILYDIYAIQPTLDSSSMHIQMYIAYAYDVFVWYLNPGDGWYNMKV